MIGHITRKGAFNISSFSKIGGLIVALCLFSGVANAADFSIKADSHIGFKTKKLGFVSVSGHFKSFSGNLSLNEKEQITALSGEVLIASIFTDSTKRDKHLLEADYFDANAFQTGNFVMSEYREISRENGVIKGVVSGDLRLHGKIVRVELESELNTQNATNPTLNLKGKINIKDFGMKGSKMASDEVEINLETAWE